jgi:prepilin-type N-terminal cleavage/methylation domain-containing protein
MSHRSTKRQSGFSLLEMVVATAIGTIVLGAAVQMYIQGVSATWTVSQRAEMQQDFRAASNILTTDLSLAGAGLGQDAAIALPTTANTPVLGCDQTHTCYINGTSVKYPITGGTPYLYGLLPGYADGPTINGLATDIVTAVYTDTSFYLNCYTATATSSGVITFGPPSGFTTWAATGCLPSGTSLTAPQAVNDSVVGLTPGDLVWMNLGGVSVVAEVTGAVSQTGTNTYTVPFNNNDVLKMNQTASGYYLNSATANATGTSPTRILVNTYYLDNTVTPTRLMEQVSGHAPMPIAENVVYLKFSYNLYNDSTSSPAVNCTNPGATADGCGGASTGLLPSQITKINILNMAMDSTVKSAQFGLAKGYQTMNLQTSVSARNLTYSNNYPQ